MDIHALVVILISGLTMLFFYNSFDIAGVCHKKNNKYTTIPTDAKTTPSTDKNTNRIVKSEGTTLKKDTSSGVKLWKAGTIAAVCITCLTVVVSGILFYFLKYKRIPTEKGDDDVEERKAFIAKIYRAALDSRFNSFVKALNEAMSPVVLENIKKQLQERPENKSKLASLGNPDQLLTYLDRTYHAFKNVYFLQGLFLAAQAPELYKICLDYAKTREKKIIFFEKQILETDHTKVQYFVDVPNVSSYSNSDLEALQGTIATLLFANYDDVIVCGIQNGCVIVIFMIRNYLIPHLRVLFGSKEKILFQKMLRHKIFKVVVRDDVIYIRDRQIVVNKSNDVAKPVQSTETGMDKIFHIGNVAYDVVMDQEKSTIKDKIKEMRKNREPLEVPWRDVGENFFSVQKKQELTRFIDNLRFPDGCQHINLFMTGHIGSGKSCFANTLKTVLEDTGEIASPAVTYGIDKKSETRKLHEITLKTYENGKSIRIYDCRGIEPTGDEQAFKDDLCKIISGHVMKDYVFEATTIEPKYKQFRDHPSISDKMHCVLFVMKATDETKVPPILDDLKDFLGKENIPLRLILTSMDQLELYELRSIRSVFWSRDAKVKVERAKAKFDLQDNQILPIANYVSGINQDVYRDVLALQAAKNILQEANSFIADNM